MYFESRQAISFGAASRDQSFSSNNKCARAAGSPVEQIPDTHVFGRSPMLESPLSPEKPAAHPSRSLRLQLCPSRRFQYLSCGRIQRPRSYQYEASPRKYRQLNPQQSVDLVNTQISAMLSTEKCRSAGRLMPETGEKYTPDRLPRARVKRNTGINCFGSVCNCKRTGTI